MSNSTVKQPLWVELAFSSISKRQHAIWLTLASVLFTIGFAVWWLLFDGDWSWAAWTSPMPVWYGLAIRWMDSNNAW